jgi:hypothetical protein
MIEQECTNCKVMLPIDAFEWQKNRPNPRKVCKQCRYGMRDREKEQARHREYSKERRRLFPDAVRESWERTKYGVAKSDFNYAECWICGSNEKLCIDHCHTTGVARGLLCTFCNTALGYFKDDTAKMEKAIQYLRDGPHYELDRRVYK